MAAVDKSRFPPFFCRLLPASDFTVSIFVKYKFDDKLIVIYRGFMIDIHRLVTDIKLTFPFDCVLYLVTLWLLISENPMTFDMIP